MASGSVWTYRGTSIVVPAGTPYAPSTQNVYSNVTSQQGSAGSLTETSTNTDHTGAGTQSVSVLGGQVRVKYALDFGNGKSVPVDATELRSPVRTDDQYTLVDTRVTDSGFDFDGDGVNDAIDVAIYSKVVGPEMVDLVSAPQTPTVRVRTTLLTRARYSKTGTFTDVVSATEDDWYAPGIGIVKHVGDAPAAVAGNRDVTTEVLVNWDGVTQGLGYLDPVASTLADGSRVKYVLSAIGFDTHALMLSWSGATSSAGFRLTALDARGKVTSSTAYPGIGASRAQLLRVGGSARVVAFDNFDLKMFAFDANGATTSAPVTLKASTQNFAYAANNSPEVVGASDGSTIWLAWLAYPASSSDPLNLIATPFDASGAQLAPARVLATSAPSGVSINNLKSAGSATGVVFEWDDLSGTHYAIAAPSSLNFSVHTAATAHPPTFLPVPVTWASGAGLLWNLLPNMAGVSFDANGEPLRSNASAIDQENLALPWLSNVQFVRAGTGGGTKLDTFQFNYSPLWPGEAYNTNQSVVTELSPGAGPLATQSNARLLAKGIFAAPDQLVSLPGSILAINNAPDGGVSVTSVWRRP